jgi:DNA repair exonuclease SbcCD nuclease subunit
LLFHGSDRDRIPPGKESVAPFSASDIERAGASYAMVGHFHGLQQGPRHAYPGSLEPHTFAQDGRHTVSIVSVEDGKVSAEFVDANSSRYMDLEFDISPYADRAALVDALRSTLDGVVDTPGSVFCRVRLVGEAVGSLEVNVRVLEAELSERYPGVQLVEEYAAFDYGSLQRGRTVRAEFVRTMQQRIAAAEGDERELLQEALRYGLLAFADKPIPIAS